MTAQPAHRPRLRLVPDYRRTVAPLDDTDLVRYYDVISADGTRLRAWTNDTDGSLEAAGAPVVLLCNGLGTNPYSWPSLLSDECEVRIISWNHRGTGGSERPEDPKRCGIPEFVEDALAVMDDTGIDACPLMGWSMGVNTMFELTVDHPDRVTGLFAVAGVPGDTFASMLAPFHLPRFVRHAITVNAARTMEVFGPLLTLVSHQIQWGPIAGELLTHSGFMLPTPDLANTRRTVKELLSTPIEWYMHLAVATSSHRKVSLSRIKVPAMFVAGRWDVLASAHDMRTASERIEGAEYVELRGSHFIGMEKPVEVYELLLQLLDRVG
ncbi:MAG: alpha/beta fold hydrolase [Marmoricola sp.]